LPPLADAELAESQWDPCWAGEKGEHCAVVMDVRNVSVEPILSTDGQRLWLEAAAEATSRDVDEAAAADDNVVADVDNDEAVEAGTGVEMVAGAAAARTALQHSDDGYKVESPRAKAAIGNPAAEHTGPGSRVAVVLDVAAAVVVVVVATECKTSAASDLC
jgi:hypothetical protein